MPLGRRFVRFCCDFVQVFVHLLTHLILVVDSGRAQGEYLSQVLETESRNHADLRVVREHIQSCFNTVDAFALPHPGFEVADPNFDGDVRPQAICKALFINRLSRSLLTDRGQIACDVHVHKTLRRVIDLL